MYTTQSLMHTLCVTLRLINNLYFYLVIDSLYLTKTSFREVEQNPTRSDASVVQYLRTPKEESKDKVLGWPQDCE